MDYDDLIEKILDLYDMIDQLESMLDFSESPEFDCERKCECKKETLQKK